MRKFLCLLLLCSPVLSKAQIAFSLLPSQPPDCYPSIAIDPTNGDIYAMNYIRVLRSSNGGATWTALHNTGVINGLNVLFFSPAGQLYLGCGNTLAAPQVGIEMYNKATDTWTPVTGAPKNVTAITLDNSGNLIAGTGTTGNFNPYPVNYGTGIYSYNGSSWTAINSGIANLSGYSVLPYIKAFAKTAGGTLLAATYGTGVLQYNAGTWSIYGTGLTDKDVSSLLVTNAGTVIAGCDSTVWSTTGSTWGLLNAGLPKKPMRSLAQDGTGKLYAGLGFYHWMDGKLAGDIYTSNNNGTSWQNSTGNYTSSDVLSLAVDASNNIYIGSTGVHKTANGGSTWSTVGYLPGGAGQTTMMAKTSYGALFTICDNYPQYSGYSGLFRSLDSGATWQQVINGIQRHRGDMIYCDRYDHLWAAFSTLDNLATNGSHRHSALYESVDTGKTWVQNTSILVPTLQFNAMTEAPNGKMYISSGWGAPTDISSSVDSGATWDNTLNGTGGDGFGCATNANNDVFVGGEGGGVMRSTSNGAPGSFSTVAVGGPQGNCSVFVDPYTQYVFATGQQGPVTSLSFYGSSTNGSTMFPMSGLPTFISPTNVVFDNRGNMYAACASADPNKTGLWTASAPWSSSTVFTRIMANAFTSYQFNTEMLDACGNLYGVIRGAGVLKSNMPFNTPASAILKLPANGATGVALTPTLTWSHGCAPDSFRLQIAADTAFTAPVVDVTMPTSYSYTVPSGMLTAGTSYYWRLRATNKAGTGSWSARSAFSTVTILGIDLLGFIATVKSPSCVALDWQAIASASGITYVPRRSTDGIHFQPLPGNTTMVAANQYRYNDTAPLKGTSYYNILTQGGADDGTVSATQKVYIKNSEALQCFPVPAHNVVQVLCPDAGPLTGSTATITDAAGKAIATLHISGPVTTIDIHEWPAGAYSLTLSDGTTVRILKE